MEDHVLVRAVDIGDTRVYDLDTCLEHQFLELLEGVAGRVALQVALLVGHVVVGQSTWRDERDVRELEVANGKQRLHEGDAGVRSAHHHNPRVLEDLRLAHESLGREAEGERRLFLVQRVPLFAVDRDD